MKRTTLLGLLGLLMGSTLLVAPARGQEVAPPPSQPIVDLAICLDTSGSMEGLIDAARQKLWAITNDLALAEPTPRFRVALLTFGNDGHDAAKGWVHVQTDLTEDLDLVSKRLFEQVTNGGTEYVGRVLQAAVTQLSWDASPDALKLIFVAGNESADQDRQVNFRDACRRAIGGGIMVNSIYCGNPSDDIAPAWREVARLADGHFASIDQNNGTVSITTPFDDELAALSSAINDTYVAYGDEGEEAKENQKLQDSNAAGTGISNAAQRAQTKGGKFYRNAWDLVEAWKDGRVKLEEVKKEDLPEAMREMTLEQKKKFLEEQLAKRTEMQKQIADLGKKRQGYVEEEMRKNAEGDGQAFDKAVRDAVREQAQKKGFRFEEN